ncbi:hypothetical protein WICMUC_002413 [Wickerhamomyces mucosus]|uniref:Protein kinase domain-containing protein n=1 Tax=Wickerhamomyces mucosus TaxID=1378264 RepID=A0A9P8TF63_9ASCO|nr:hypothetical protein WICMUC_002413 [Wickerhamomyces mucosus]
MSLDNNLNGVIINNYQIIKLIGTGAYGLVYLAKNLQTGEHIAIKAISKIINKKISKPSDLLSNKLLEFFNNGNSTINGLKSLDLVKLSNCNIDKDLPPCPFLKEVVIHLKLHQHPNIITIHQILDFNYCIFIIMDYYSEGDLFVNIVDKKIYQNSISLIKNCFIQLLDVISYCHSKGIFHCDIKPENIMVSSNGSKLIIGDFGLATQCEFINSKICVGSSYYMPPERLCQLNHNLSSSIEYPSNKGDLWSLSIILINLICIRNPWMKASEQDPTFNAFLQNPKILLKILPISNELYEILIKCLIENPFERISLFELRDLIINCNKFTKDGPLSKIDSLDQYMNLNQECLIPDYNNSTNSLEKKKSKTLSIGNSPILNQIYNNEPLNVLKFLSNGKNTGNMEPMISIHHINHINNYDNYSLMTNLSFNMNMDLEQQVGY